MQGRLFGFSKAGRAVPNRPALPSPLPLVEVGVEEIGAPI